MSPGVVPKRVAALDCGTNALRLLIAELNEEGQLIDVLRRMETVRLGEGVDATGVLSEAALARTFAGFEDYAQELRKYGVTKVRCVATSASRDARNAEEFVRGVVERIGVEPEVITGTEEAELSFAGATMGLSGLEMPALIVDLGGGSTEFVLGTERPEFAWSANVGCVRMTERHLRSNPPSLTERELTQSDVDAAIDEAAAHVPLSDAHSIVGLAGTVTTVAAQALHLDRYDAEVLHGARIKSEDVVTAARQLTDMTREQRAALPFMHPGRVDVIGGGAMVLARIVERVGLPELVVSEHDLLDGIAYSLAHEAK